MKFRTKIYLFFVAVAFFSVFWALTVDYFETKRYLLKQLSSSILSVAATAATELEPEDLKAIHHLADIRSEPYLSTKKTLRKIRLANQRDDLFIRYLYVIRPSPSHPGFVETIGDASEAPEAVSPVGELHSDKQMNHLLEHLYKPYAPQKFMNTEYGTSLSAFAPVYDAQHNYVATVGADAYATHVTYQLHRLLLYGAISFGVALLLALILATILSKVVTRSLNELCIGANEIGKGNFHYQFKMTTHDEFEKLSEAMNKMCLSLEEKERLKENFSRYVSAHVMEKILHANVPLKLEGEKRKITVLFSDIRNFTTLSEKLQPEVVVGVLNEYFSVMLDVIFKNGGTLDKFLGDGIMVEFGTPLDDRHQEKHAVTCALQMQEALHHLSLAWEKQKKPFFTMGIGIHSGEAVVGNIGTLKRMEYTAIGDTVNVASRIEQETKRLARPILVSEATWLKIQDEFHGENLGGISLPGRLGKIILYAVSWKK